MEDGLRLLFKKPILFLPFVAQVLFNFFAGQYMAQALLKIISPALSPQGLLWGVPAALAEKVKPSLDALPSNVTPLFNQALIEKLFAVIWEKLYEIMRDVAPVAFLSGLIGFILTLLTIRLIYNATRGELNFFDALKLALKQFLPLTIASLFGFVFTAAGAVLFIIPVIIIFLRLSFFSFTGMLDQGNTWSSLTKSWVATKGNTLRIAAFYVIFVVLFVLATGAMDLFVSFPPIVLLIYSFVMGVFLNAVFLTAMTMVYAQMRTGEEQVVDNFVSEHL